MQLEIRKLDAFGAEVSGIDLRDMTLEDRAHLYRLWLDHGLLVFRGLEYDPEMQLELASCFGSIRNMPLPDMLVDSDPRLLYLGNKGDQDYLAVHLVNGEPRRGFLYWHCDQIFFPTISKGSLLAMSVVPPSGGDTVFADTARAYDELPGALKARIEGLSSVHQPAGTPARAWGAPGMSICVVPENSPRSEERPSLPSYVRQPLVITHEETGRKALLLSALNFVKIPELPREEGEALFEQLMTHAIKPQYRYRHRWSVGDMVMWDNRRSMHHTPGYPLDEERMASRATLDEGQLTGRYYTE